MKTIYLLVGVPGSGKTTLANKLRHKFQYVANDDWIGKDYLQAIKSTATHGQMPVLCEAPFSVSQLVDPLTASGFKVECFFIIEQEEVLIQRYQQREGKPIPTGHLTRQKTYMQRALSTRSFYGTADEVAHQLGAILIP